MFLSLPHSFGVFFILVSLTEVTQAYRCLSCNNVISPRHCHTVRNCDEHEVCVTEAYQNANGDTYYNVGCRSKETCRTRSKLRVGHARCHECCQYDLCNLRGCGEKGYPVSRGPVCYSCSQSRSETGCDTAQFCGIDEVCQITRRTELSDTIYTSQCQPATHCKTISLSHGLGRKRATKCDVCCDTDLCNNNCTAPNPIKYPKSCKEALILGSRASGRYEIDLFQNGTLINVQCDMTTDGGGWTIFQQRYDGTLSFDRTWNEYKHGFGDPEKEYWLGNDALHTMTEHGARLYMKTSGLDNVHMVSKYGFFFVDIEDNDYKLAVTNYLPSSTTDILSENNGMRFSTKDRDEDGSPNNCAVLRGGGFWYSTHCHIQLNGAYINNPSRTNSTFMLREN